MSTDDSETGAGADVRVDVVRHALDRVPLSLIVDDSAPLVNLNYFFLRDRNEHTGERRRWEDVPVVIPESFTREWVEWCLEHGVKGKYSVVPCPAGIERIDRDLPLFGQKQLAIDRQKTFWKTQPSPLLVEGTLDSRTLSDCL